MSQNSKIEWTDHTFNPWEGCQKVGPGCDHCYAETRNARFSGGTAINWGPGAPRRRTSAANWRKPLAWNAQHEAFLAEHGRRQRVFCASLADVFDNAVDPAWRMDLFRLIESTPNLDWLLLTKRIGNARAMSQAAMGAIGCMHKPLPSNVWIGATITSQAEADRDIPKLLDLPARVRFLSIEPLLGPVDLSAHVAPPRLPWLEAGTPLCRELPSAVGCARAGPHYPGEFGCRWSKVDTGGSLPSLNWVIVGGESGPGARPMHPDWARGLRDQCAAAGVPFLFKQWGEWAPPTKLEDLRCLGDLMRAGKAIHVYGNGREPDGHFRKGDDHMLRVGKKAAGRLLDGVQHDGFPESACPTS